MEIFQENVYFFTKIYLVGTHWNHHTETIPMSTHKAGFAKQFQSMCVILWGNSSQYTQVMV